MLSLSFQNLLQIIHLYSWLKFTVTFLTSKSTFLSLLASGLGISNGTLYVLLGPCLPIKFITFQTNSCSFSLSIPSVTTQSLWLTPLFTQISEYPLIFLFPLTLVSVNYLSAVFALQYLLYTSLVQASKCQYHGLLFPHFFSSSLPPPLFSFIPCLCIY